MNTTVHLYKIKIVLYFSVFKFYHQYIIDFHRRHLSIGVQAVFPKNSRISTDANETNRRTFCYDAKIFRRSFFSSNYFNSTVDDFRAREEAKEQEHLKQEEERQKMSESEKNNKVKEEKLASVRLKILEASLPFVEKYGWTIEAITKGAESVGLPGVAHGLLPNGSIELILYFYSSCNMKLVEYLKENTKNGEIIPKEPTEFLVKAARYRLEMLIPYKKHWPQALAKMALPQHVPKSLAQILTMVDDICYFAGDRSVDFGWYTRRVGMSAIYKLSELYMLQDSSENHKATWEFLQNRMNEAQVVELVFGQSGEPNQRTKNKLNATFETARNILGLNYDRRI